MAFSEPTVPVDARLPELLGRICVRPPYFALEELECTGSTLTAVARAEMRIGGERGPMTGAELGRHAAIAGLCGAAMRQEDDRRRYYLAQRAECRYYRSDAPFGSEVALRAQLVHLDKRQARSWVTVRCQGQPLADLDISYTILTEPAFARLFAARRQGTAAAAAGFEPLLHGDLRRDARSAEFEVGSVPVEACSGHFDDFPVLPVAVLMGKLSELAGVVLGAPAVPYRVSRGSVSARDLCWAGDPVTFGVDLRDMIGSEAHFSCTAESEGRTVGSMKLVLETG